MYLWHWPLWLWHMLEGNRFYINLLVSKAEVSTLVWREWLSNSRMLDIHLKHSWRRTKKRRGGGLWGVWYKGKQTRLAKAMCLVDTRFGWHLSDKICSCKNASFKFSTAIKNIKYINQIWMIEGEKDCWIFCEGRPRQMRVFKRKK